MIPNKPFWRGLGLTLLLFTVLCTRGRAQDIRVNVIVPNPPPAYWEAYLEFEADIRIILSNVSSQTREVKLIPTLTSDRGLSAAFQPSFQPLSPITLGGGETVNLTYRDLRAIFGTPTEADIQLGGISFDRLFESETIPEGTYTLCVQAVDFATNEPLSNNFGCDVFYVQQHEPPLIIFPGDGAQVPSSNPQFINFLWSTTGIPGRVRYRFALYDLEELGLNNPADAFLLQATRPLLEIDDLVANTFAYDLGFPPLVLGRQYAVQVTAYDPAGELLFAQNGQSQVHQFRYGEVLQGVVIDPPDQIVAVPPEDGGSGIGDGGGGQFVNDQPDQQLAMGGCPATPPGVPVPTPTTLTNGQTVTVAGFDLILNTGGPTPLAGTGRVLIPSLNTYVNVSFTGLEVNQTDEVVGNNVEIVAVAGGNPDLNNLTEGAALQLADLVDNNGSWLSPDGPPGAAVNLPAGLPGAGMDLILTGMTFTPGNATLDLFAKIELPEAQEESRLLLVGQGACLSAEDLGTDMDLTLASDATFALNEGVDLTFNGGEDGTRLRWNGAGIEELDVDARLTFDQSVVVTDGPPLTASFTATVTDFQDWTATANLNTDALAVPGMDDFPLALLPGEIVYDHSAVNGPPGFALPASHDLAGNENLWQGVYIPGLEFNFPEGIDAAVNLEDIVLDQLGVWLDVNINGNILSFGDGADVGNWPLAIDHLGLDIRGSSVESASFGGAIRLPISETAVEFDVPIGDGGDFSLALDIDGNLDVDMWVAQLNLQNSTILVAKEGEVYVPTATLNGSISVGWEEEDDLDDSAVRNFDLPGINFQDFTITGGPGMPQLAGTFGLDLDDYDQGGLANFPLHFVTDDEVFDPIEFIFAENEVGLRLNLGLNLTQQENGFGGSVAFTLFADWDPGQKNFGYSHTKIDQISIEAELNLISFYGSITFYNGDATYGDGFDGEIKVAIQNVGAGLDMRLQVGRAQGGFRYFMVDALLKLPPPGIVMAPTPLAFQGFGGGFWYNMTRTPSLPDDFNISDAQNVDQSGFDPGQGASATFVPDEGTFGFSAKIIVGLAAAERAVNGDFTLAMEMDTDLSLNSIEFGGNVYVMQAMDDRDGGFLTGGATISLDFVNQNYTFTSELDVSLPAGIATIQIDLDAGFSTNPNLNPKPWHFYLGRWTPDTDPREDDSRIAIESGIDFGFINFELESKLYFMMGNQIPLGLPDVPHEIVSLLADEGKTPKQTEPLPSQTAKGFAFGAYRSMDFGFNALIFRLDVDWMWGFDLLLSDQSDLTCDAEDFGINEWYANGQAYAYLGVEGSVEGKLFGKKRKFTFAEIEAGALLNFAGPNPLWLKGSARIKGRALGKLIKFDTRVSFEFGEKVNCRSGSGNIFDDIPIVENFAPEDGQTGRSIFTTPQVSFNFPQGAFPIEEETVDGDYMTNYYGYQINHFKVWSRPTSSLQGQNVYADANNTWQLVSGVQPAQYASDGYSAKFDIDGELPPFSDIRMEIEVVGVRYTSSSGNSVAETFETQKYLATFETGPPPDNIIFGSIDNSRPFRRQLYFHPADNSTGMLSFHHPQWSNLFRKKPNIKDKLDPAGNFTYWARVSSVASGQYRDMPIPNPDSDSGLSFNMPQNFLQPEKIYKIDILRKYTAPAGAGGTNVVLVDLKLIDAAGPGDGFDFVNPGQPGGGGDPPGPGGVLAGNLMVANVEPGQQNGQLAQVAQLNLQAVNQGAGNQAGNGQIAVEPVDPGPDPPFVPGFDLTDQPVDPGIVGPGGFVSPGGNLSELQRQSRELKKKRLTNSVVTKSLWPPGQSKWYFKVSKYASRSQKIGQLSVQPSNNPGTRYTSHFTDELYDQNTESIKVPYILLETDEGFDRFETTYWDKTFQAKDLGQDIGNPAERFYKPDLTFNGQAGNWRDVVFYGDPSNGSQSNGLFDYPLGQEYDWCYEQFYDPDNELNDTPLNPAEGANALLHSFGTHTWYNYQKYGSDYADFAYGTRYGSVSPFGRNEYDRRLPKLHDGSQFFQHNAEKPLVEFAQWSSNGTKPEGLPGSASNTRTLLTMAMINAVNPVDVNPPTDELAFDIPDPGIFLQPGLNLNLQVGQGQQQHQSQGQGQQYIGVVDFTEWVTFQDYILFRKALVQGMDELLDRSNSGPNSGTPYLNQHPNGLDDCGTTLNPMDSPDNYNFYVWYYLPIRSYFKIWSGEELNHHGDDYFPYPARPAGDYQFLLEGRQFDYTLPQINDAPSQY
ncbi:MAG: hypothetical protein AAFZ52_00405 [Bacteroidota bacterium]